MAGRTDEYGEAIVVSWARIATTNENFQPLIGVEVECFDVDTLAVISVVTSDLGGIALFTDLSDSQRFFFKVRARRTSTRVQSILDPATGRTYTGVVRLQILNMHPGMNCYDYFVEPTGHVGTHKTIQAAITAAAALPLATTRDTIHIGVLEGAYAENLTVPSMTNGYGLVFSACRPTWQRPGTVVSPTVRTSYPVQVDGRGGTGVVLVYTNGTINNPVVFIGFYLRGSKSGSGGVISAGRGSLRFLQSLVKNESTGHGILGGGVVAGSGADYLDFIDSSVEVAEASLAVSITNTYTHFRNTTIVGGLDILTMDFYFGDGSTLRSSRDPAMDLGDYSIISGRYKVVDSYILQMVVGSRGICISARSVTAGGGEAFIIEGNNIRTGSGSTVAAIETHFRDSATRAIILGNHFTNWAKGVKIAAGDGVVVGPNAYDNVADPIDGTPTITPDEMGHNLLSALHLDTLAASVLDGDVIIGNVTPKWSRLAISIPAANVRNVFGIDNAELRPSWKTALDATNPANIASTASPGTSLVFSHRDHIHAHPVFTSGALHTDYELVGVAAGLIATHAGLPDVHHAGFIGLTIAGPANIDPNAGDRITIEDTASVTWASSGAGKIAATAVAGGVDHGGLAGLLDDDHTQYLLLAGRAGAQQDIVKGITVATYMRVGSATAPANTTVGDLTVTRLSVGNKAFSLDRVLDVYRESTSVAITDAQAVYIDHKNNPGEASDVDRRAIMVRAEYQSDFAESGIVYGGGFGFYLTGTGVVADGGGVYAYGVAPRTGAGAAMSATNVRAVHALLFDAYGRAASETMAVAKLHGLHVQLEAAGSSFIAGDAVQDAAGVYVENIGDSHIVNAVGVDIEAQSGATTLNFGIRNAGNMVQTGYMRLGAVTVPTNVTNGDLTLARLNIGNGAFTNSGIAYLYSSLTVNATDIGVLLLVLNSPTVNGAYEQRALSVQARYGGAANNTSVVYGANYEVDVYGTGKPSYTVALGGIGLVARTGAAAAMSAGDCRALNFQLFGNASRVAAETITIDALTGVRIEGGYAGFITGDAVTNVYGINIQNLGNAKVTNAYGIYIAGVSAAATLNVGIKLDGCTTAALWLNSDTAAEGTLAWGTTRDTNLYRSAANVLKTDDAFHAVLGLVADTVAELTPTAGVTVDGCLIKDGRAALALGLRETSGPTDLVVGAVADGEYLKRVGATIVSGVPAGGGSMATDTLWDAAGDLAVGTGADAGARLALTVPAGAALLNVLGVLNGETTPTWKVLFDATNPTTIGVSDVAAPGTQTIAAHRDHQHGSPATFPATAHNILSATHGDSTAHAAVVGDLITGQAGPVWARLAVGSAGAGLWTDGTDTSWTVSPRYAGYLRVGSAAAPTNTTAGDLTVIRGIVGTDEALGASVLLDLNSVTGALLLSRMTTVQKAALTPVAGMVLYDSTLNQFFGYHTGWQRFLMVGTPADYTVTNAATDRTYDANATTIDELADVLGTVIADLIALGVFQ